MTQNAITSVSESIDRIIATVKGLSEETIRWNPTEEEWSIMQILCHIVEAVPYWLSEIEQLLQSPGTEWGRNHLQERRLNAVSPTVVDATSVAEILEKLVEVKLQVKEEIENLTPEQLAAEAPSRNPNFGSKPISFIIDDLIDKHVNKHEGQIQRNLSKLTK